MAHRWRKSLKPTELVYSSHDRCEYLHRDWIVQRALESHDNKTLFYLPFSSGNRGDQEYSWGTFSWYLDRFRGYGLQPRTFFWTEDLNKQDIDLFFDWLATSEVVILGGGMTMLGLQRYAQVGERGFGDPGRFVRILRERSARGLLTVGFSAGADQLCEWSCDGNSSLHCFGNLQQLVVRLHYEPAADEHMTFLARTHPDCLVFGLPNDSGIAYNEGYTARGLRWQVLLFIIDSSWDRPEDHWHIKTRQGVRIEHRYPDGRDWKFNGGDILVRVFDAQGGAEAWIGGPHYDRFVHHTTQQPSEHHDIVSILNSR